MAEPAPRAEEPLERPIAWLVSFPKSGNTWTRVLLSNLLAHEYVDDKNFAALLGSISSNRRGFDQVTGLPSSDMTDDEIDLVRPDFYRALAAASRERQFVKVHDGYHDSGGGEPLFPAECSCGAIYLVRHPYDVAVSYANHQGHEDFDRIVEQMNGDDHIMAGGSKSQLRQRTLGWRGHYLSWHEQRAIPLLTIRYEDMLAETAACLTRMAEFLKLEEAQDDAAIARAVEESRFEKLRAKEDAHGFGEKPENAGRFFNSGRSGDGRKRLSTEQRQRLYEHNRDVMEVLGYEP